MVKKDEKDVEMKDVSTSEAAKTSNDTTTEEAKEPVKKDPELLTLEGA